MKTWVSNALNLLIYRDFPDTCWPIRNKYFPWPQHDDHRLNEHRSGCQKTDSYKWLSSLKVIDKLVSERRPARWAWEVEKKSKKWKEGWWADGKMASGKTFGKVRGQAAIFSWHEDTDHTFTLNSILRKKEEEKKKKTHPTKSTESVQYITCSPGTSATCSPACFIPV